MGDRSRLLLLHENFADITHVAVVDPYIAPPVLRSSPPPLEVEVTENNRCRFPVPTNLRRFLSGKQSCSDCRPMTSTFSASRAPSSRPGLWVDRWDVYVDSASNRVSDPYLPLYTCSDTDLPGQNAACMAGQPKLRAR